MDNIVTNLELIVILVCVPCIAGYITYQILISDLRKQTRTYDQVMRELEMQAEVREHNAPWWSARKTY